MVISQGETRNEVIRNNTINGLNISVLLEATADNTALPLTGYRSTSSFDPSNVNIEVILKRDGKNYTLVNTNLAIIGHYMTILQGGSLWRKGITLVPKAAGTKHLATRPLFIYLGGHYNLSGQDEIYVSCTVNRGTFGTAVSTTNSKIQIEANPSIGVEKAIHQMHTYAIQANQQSDTVNLGDNVTRIALLSFETDFTKQVFKSCSLSSDRLDWTANEMELILRHWDKFPYDATDVLFQDVPDTSHPLYYPNTFLIHDQDEIDKARLQFQMNPTNVEASENFVVWTTFQTSEEIIMRAAQRQQKHSERNLNKIPLSI
jgi:hypothetical protein